MISNGTNMGTLAAEIKDIKDLENKNIVKVVTKKYLNKYKLLLVKAEDEHKLLKKYKWEYYTGKAEERVYKEQPFDLKILRQDIDKYLDADGELQKTRQKVRYLEVVIDYLDKTVKQISNRGFLIKSMIDWRKFINGE